MRTLRREELKSVYGGASNNNPGENNTNLQGNQPKDGGGGGNPGNNNPGENNTNLAGNQPKDWVDRTIGTVHLKETIMRRLSPEETRLVNGGGWGPSNMGNPGNEVSNGASPQPSGGGGGGGESNGNPGNEVSNGASPEPR
jgi:hypothetical protein